MMLSTSTMTSDASAVCGADEAEISYEAPVPMSFGESAPAHRSTNSCYEEVATTSRVLAIFTLHLSSTKAIFRRVTLQSHNDQTKHLALGHSHRHCLCPVSILRPVL